MTDQELMNLKAKLTKAEQEVAENQGALKAAQARLKAKGYKTVGEAEKALDKLNKAHAASTKAIQEVGEQISDMLEEVGDGS